MKVTTSNLFRWTGLSAMLAGIIFAGIQPIHPPDELSSVTTTAWAVITPFKTLMCMFFLLGITGIYVRQAEKVGWLGLAGYLMFSVSWALNLAFVFAEAFIMPPLAALAPTFVDGYQGIAAGRASSVDFGALPALYALTGILYLLGGVLFGVAIFRAGILPRRAGGLLAITALLTPLAALLPHQIQRYAAVPMGIAVAWLGYALWSERREHTTEPVPSTDANTDAGMGIPQISQTGAE